MQKYVACMDKNATAKLHASCVNYRNTVAIIYALVAAARQPQARVVTTVRDTALVTPISEWVPMYHTPSLAVVLSAILKAVAKQRVLRSASSVLEKNGWFYPMPSSLHYN